MEAHIQLFFRIVSSAKHKERHGYRLSYAFDVGSSFDPDMEDPIAWEEELSGMSFTSCFNHASNLVCHRTQSNLYPAGGPSGRRA